MFLSGPIMQNTEVTPNALTANPHQACVNDIAKSVNNVETARFITIIGRKDISSPGKVAFMPYPSIPLLRVTGLFLSILISFSELFLGFFPSVFFFLISDPTCQRVILNKKNT